MSPETLIFWAYMVTSACVFAGEAHVASRQPRALRYLCACREPDVPANANRFTFNAAMDIDIAAGRAQVAAQRRADTNGAANERGIPFDLVIDTDLPAGPNSLRRPPHKRCCRFAC